MDRILAKNRPSPVNEDEYRAAYLKTNPSAGNKDKMDIACVISLLGVKGHGLMDQSENRSKDNNYHWVYDFVSDSELEKLM